MPDALLVVNCFFLAPDAQHQKVESSEGIRWHPEDVRTVHFSPGLWADDWFFMAGAGAIRDYENFVFVTAPPGLPYYFSDIEIQTEWTMTPLREQLEGNDLSLANVVDARVYLVRAQRDYRAFARAWRRIWEPVGPMPSMNLIPSRQRDGRGGMMMEDLIVEIDLIAHREQGS